MRLDAPEEVVRACVAGAGIGFMFAPTFHHGLGYLTPIRRALGFRTIFNVLGPLANPALGRAYADRRGAGAAARRHGPGVARAGHRPRHLGER